MIAAISRNKIGFNFLKNYTGATRVCIHITFWMLFYVFVFLYFWEIYKINGLMHLKNYHQLGLFCGILLIVTLYLHYGAVYLVTPLFKRNIALGLGLILLYTFSAYCVNQLLLQHFIYGPNEQSDYSFYSRHLLSFGNLAFFLNISIYFGCLTVTLKLALNYYRTARKTLLLTQLRNDIEVDFLKSQIKPHFLFNALNSIYGMALNDTAAIAILLDFSKLLRYLLYQSQEHVPLEEELDIIRIFTQINQQLNPALHIQFNYDHVADRIIKKYALFSQVQKILNHPDATQKEYTLILDNDKLYFR
ncbi:histidine kinase [Chitinophaga sp.]|uniref:histidine kinase n=1 Tax=Chitinophaga sp. TaxID=1869181 RepID=UPI0031E3D8DD